MNQIFALVIVSVLMVQAYGRSQPMVCTSGIHYVCGQDGITYPNQCTMEAAGVTLAFDGRCNCMITLEYSPVCGVNGKTYSNDGARRCVGVPLAFRGECPCGCFSLLFDPVCGTDGQTYNNECILNCQNVTKDYDGECKTS